MDKTPNRYSDGLSVLLHVDCHYEI